MRQVPVFHGSAEARGVPGTESLGNDQQADPLPDGLLRTQP